MEKAWNIVKMIFASVDRGYLIRSYILGFLYMAIVVAPHTFMYWHRDTTWITLLLFPFANFVNQICIVVSDKKFTNKYS